ncbi:pyridoxal-phosphate dependent enzyme [Plantactinospora sp. S1510]|uniref:Pyridoxal-phosphate dependent enzyme n=1 Tax=Plantactinospora alkalitolerans TaxID=2789879 RepID=A0ABS0H664_9ACTN|nr:pyridoxal-phosphate dependent enzyme [Plantactinospora alkalitolerans]MBF9133946.1 pyridoxal-phosphate dependent enzyme [Plantactinospora alkalitolerans]
MVELIPAARITEAAARIQPHVLRTPTVASPGLAEVLDVPVALKLEILQHSGSFKPRGIANKLLSLPPEDFAAGLVTVSGGNHGLALAAMAARMGGRATVVMPQAAPARSIARVRATGATLLLTSDVSHAFEIAEEHRQRGMTYVDPLGDPAIVAGHGTVGAEFVADRPDLTDVLVSIGCGGLISGVATAIKAANPAVRIWGVETVGAESMSRALAAGQPVRVGVTSISTTLGAPTVSELTLAHVRAYVEEVLVVSDAEAIDGVLTVADEAKLWLEPAAGCLVPAARRVIERVGRDAVLGLVLCGGNATVADVVAWADRTGGLPRRYEPVAG